MSTPRERIPVDKKYIQALGRAAYNFAYLEWGIIWLAETIDAGFINRSRKWTAGHLALKFSNVADNIDESESDKARIVDLSKEFNHLAKERNKLLHGNPFTGAGGEQRLQHRGKHGKTDWTIEIINEFSDRLAIASTEAGNLLHDGRYAAWQKRNKSSAIQKS